MASMYGLGYGLAKMGEGLTGGTLQGMQTVYGMQQRQDEMQLKREEMDFLRQYKDAQLKMSLQDHEMKDYLAGVNVAAELAKAGQPEAAKQLYNQMAGKYRQPTIDQWQEPPEKDRYEFRFSDGTAAKFDRKTGQMEFQESPYGTPGMEVVTNPDGTMTMRTNVKGTGMTGLQKPTMNKVEGDLLDATASMMSVSEIEKLYKPEFLELNTRMGAAWAGLKSRLGQPLSTEEQQLVGQFSEFRASAGQLLADDLKRMSGAAVTPQEAERALTFIPNPGANWWEGDNPQEFKTKIDRYKQFKSRAIARLNYIRKNGFSMESVPLDSMDGIIKQRYQEIAAELQAANPNMDASQQARERLAEEFGLIN